MERDRILDSFIPLAWPGFLNHQKSSKILHVINEASINPGFPSCYYHLSLDCLILIFYFLAHVSSNQTWKISSWMVYISMKISRCLEKQYSLPAMLFCTMMPRSHCWLLSISIVLKKQSVGPTLSLSWLSQGMLCKLGCFALYKGMWNSWNMWRRCLKSWVLCESFFLFLLCWILNARHLGHP